MADHFLPYRLVDLSRLSCEGASDGAHFSQVIELLTRLLHQECHGRLNRLKDLYHGMDPDRETHPIPGEPRHSNPSAFIHELEQLLERANYRRLSDAELQQALRSESLFRVKLHTRFDDFRDLLIFVRGPGQRSETIPRMFGLKRRTVDVAFHERVLIVARFQEAEYFEAKNRKNSAKPLPFKPGSMVLKLFANVPDADIEMLLPNCEVRMKPMDQAIIGIPAAIGIATMSAKIIVILGFLWVSLKWIGSQAGIHHEAIEFTKIAAEGSLVLAAGVAIYLFIGRQLMRYRFRKIQFMKALADNLFYLNLDNQAGAFHRVLDEAFEEDSKETVLAYRFLLDQPEGSTAAELDQQIEAWFELRLQTRVDFDVEDGLAKLQRFGMAHQITGRWRSTEPIAALSLLQQRWLALAPGSAASQPASMAMATVS